MKKSIVWEFLGAYIFLILVAVLVLDFFVGLKFRDYYEKKISATLESNAILAGDLLKEDLISGKRNLIREETISLAKTLDLRITVIDGKGNVLGDSEKDPALMEDHGNREEVIAAIESGVGKSSRLSDTLGLNMKYVAVPVKEKGSILGVIRLAMPLTEVEHELRVINRVFILGGILAVILTLAIGYFISRSISLPIRKMDETARGIARGDFSKRVKIRTNDELGGLARSFNRMADELQLKIDNLGKADKIRTDFVANVSHELKTPLTSIKGFIETLEDGAIDDKENAGKFLAIIRKQAERLSNIINDLLSLTEIETGKGRIEIVEFDAKQLLDEVVWGFSHALSEKEQKLKLDYSGNDFSIKGDKDKIEQVLVNLIDNAIKYTGKKGDIRVSLFEQKDSVMLSIEDNGIGISKEHQDRIFERFYRVDKARSRESGGTGLGLSIVKHIVLLHKGYIDINSDAGRGTKVTVILPK